MRWDYFSLVYFQGGGSGTLVSRAKTEPEVLLVGISYFTLRPILKSTSIIGVITTYQHSSHLIYWHFLFWLLS